jgi:hypothetical protein
MVCPAMEARGTDRHNFEKLVAGKSTCVGGGVVASHPLTQGFAFAAAWRRRSTPEPASGLTAGARPLTSRREGMGGARVGARQPGSTRPVAPVAPDCVNACRLGSVGGCSLPATRPKPRKRKAATGCIIASGGMAAGTDPDAKPECGTPRSERHAAAVGSLR